MKLDDRNGWIPMDGLRSRWRGDLVGPMQATYHSDVEGGAPVCVRYDIAGRMDVGAYLQFVAERAGWFGISGWAAAADAQSVTVVAAGAEAMVGALEMACTLGPISALIERVEAIAERSPVAAGFEIRQK